MVLSDRSIREAIEAGRIVIDPLGEECIQPSSVDLHVDQYFRLFRNHTSRVIDVREDQEDLTELVDVGPEGPLILHPGEFMLGATVERVKVHLIDTLGCGIAAFDEKPVRICRDVALAVPGAASTVIGTDRRTTPDLAAFANGAAFRYYDLNDVYVGQLAAHPSDNIAACLAVAEAERASAAELITSIVLAY